jgi:hypothetical protein
MDAEVEANIVHKSGKVEVLQPLVGSIKGRVAVSLPGSAGDQKIELHIV